jgi:hypothetical protein
MRSAMIAVLVLLAGAISAEARTKPKLQPKPTLGTGCQPSPCLNAYLDQSVNVWHPECDNYCPNDQCFYYGGSNQNCCTTRNVCCTYLDHLNHTKYTYEMQGESVPCLPQ